MIHPPPDALGLGSATIDDFLYIDHFPQADSKQQALRAERYGGGLTATALVAVARLGKRAAFAGRMGRDDASRWVVDDLARDGVDVSAVVYDDDARPIQAWIIVEAPPRSTRTILYTVPEHHGAHPAQPGDDLICAARCLMVDDFGMVGHIRAARLARAAGIPVVGDFERPQTPGLPDLLPLVDHLIVSQRFALTATGATTPAEAALALFQPVPDRALACVTAGDAGSWYTTDGRTLQHQPTFPVEAVDTTGCGDVFHGAYMVALIDGLPVEQRIRFAAAAAALKATRSGGRLGIPTRAAVEKFMSS
jgi:sulfofructose kinase